MLLSTVNVQLFVATFPRQSAAVTVTVCRPSATPAASSMLVSDAMVSVLLVEGWTRYTHFTLPFSASTATMAPSPVPRSKVLPEIVGGAVTLYARGLEVFHFTRPVRASRAY